MQIPRSSPRGGIEIELQVWGGFASTCAPIPLGSLFWFPLVFLFPAFGLADPIFFTNLAHRFFRLAHDLPKTRESDPIAKVFDLFFTFSFSFLLLHGVVSAAIDVLTTH